MMLTFEHHDQIMICSDLKPGTWYSLQLTAHNGAGSRVVTTQFATLSLTGDLDYGDDVVIIIMIMMIIMMILATKRNLLAPPMSGLTRTASSHSGRQLFSLQKLLILISIFIVLIFIHIIIPTLISPVCDSR